MTGDTGVSTGSLIGRRRSRRLVVALTTLAVLGAGLTATSPSPSSEATPGGGFTRIATLGAYENNSDPGADAVAEISTVTPDGNTLVYTDAAGDQVGFVDISDPSRPKPAGAVGVDGEPTSVYAVGAYLLVVVDSSDGNFAQPSGHISVLDASSRTVVRTIELNGQPDSIDVRGRTAVIAIENQRDEETTPPGGTKGDLPQSPAGRLAVLDLTGDVTAWTPETVSLTGLTKITEPTDPEPEYVKISPDGTRVAVTLQENNAVAVVDLESLTVTNSFSAGTVDVAGVDTVEDGVINPTGSLTDVPREPDSLGWIDNGRLATANEGDWRGGSRGWTIFDSETGEVVWDAGNTFENALIAAGLYPEDRSDAKGTEPEGLAVAEFGGRPYVFIGSERGNVVAAYDVTDPTQPRLTQLLPSTKGPEGLLPIPDRNLLVVSSEVDDVKIGLRATVQVYAFGDQPMAYPMISSKNRPDGS
ncbi:MAG: hypothetical protein L0G99_02875, partial [Propionibacteriales bacterium]|nr:hypothetical protein [Propionibacteriales bacterium]